MRRRRRTIGSGTSTSTNTGSCTPARTARARSANKKTHYNNLAPRLGLTYGLTGDMRTILRTGFGITYFPSPYAAGNLNHLNVPFTISQNVQHQTNPLDFSQVRTIDNPFPRDRAGQAADDRGAARGQSARDRPWLLERDGVRRAMAPRHRASALLGDARRARIRRQRRQAPHALLQPERDPARARARRNPAAFSSPSRTCPTCCSAIRATAPPSTAAR